MGVYDFDVFSACVRPAETYTELIVHADTVLAKTIALQRLQPIARRHAQIV
jgi:hypothetical protein